MEDKSKYFVVKQKAVPEVLLKVVEAKKLLETERAITVQEATDKVGISRSSFYKYKDDIFPFYDNTKGKTIDVYKRQPQRWPPLPVTQWWHTQNNSWATLMCTVGQA